MLERKNNRMPDSKTAVNDLNEGIGQSCFSNLMSSLINEKKSCIKQDHSKKRKAQEELQHDNKKQTPESKLTHKLKDNEPCISDCPPSPVHSKIDLEALSRMSGIIENEKKRAPSRSYLVYHLEDGLWYEENISNSQDTKPADGRYAFVTHRKEYAQEKEMKSQVVVWPILNTNHADTFHGGLSFFQKHLAYAGEATFKKGISIEWNNASGTYKPEARKKEAATLPIAKFTLPSFSY